MKSFLIASRARCPLDIAPMKRAQGCSESCRFKHINQISVHRHKSPISLERAEDIGLPVFKASKRASFC
jgi:hypothetical protein